MPASYTRWQTYDLCEVVGVLVLSEVEVASALAAVTSPLENRAIDPIDRNSIAFSGLIGL